MIDRRIIYLFVFLALAIPLYFGFTVKPSRMRAAEKFYETVDKTETKAGEVVFVALDFGPSTRAENEPQASALIEQLFRKRLKVVTFSIVPLSEPLLKSIPQDVVDRLHAETGENWEYGTDWVNLGYLPNAGLLLQSIPKSDNLAAFFKFDANGNDLTSLPVTKDLKTVEQIKLLAQFTGYVGVFDTYLRFFQSEKYRPNFIHGCTSITIPEAYIYLDSNQINGLLEGIAGAAWYSYLLSNNFKARAVDNALLVNTGLGVAHLVIIFFIILGNIVAWVTGKKERRSA